MARLAALTPEQLDRLRTDWRFWARPEQIPPPGAGAAYKAWFLCAGRGFGKTRAGAEAVAAQVQTGVWKRVALVGPTAADVRDVMVEGESGLCNVGPPEHRPRYESSRRRLVWPNGAVAFLYSAEEPDRLRGPQHDGAWCDEPAAWRYQDTWDMLQMGLRLGASPWTVVTGTPRPCTLVRRLLYRTRPGGIVVRDSETGEPERNPTTHITRGSTYDNLQNLAPTFRELILAEYEGTRVGRQELHAELLEDVEGALWSYEMLERNRVSAAPPLKRVVVGVDPALTAKSTSDETGIVVAGQGEDGHAYVLGDYSRRGTPGEWAQKVLSAYDAHVADAVVVEVNAGGDMVRHTLQTYRRDVRIVSVTATRGKATRAEPVVALYEQGRVHHAGVFPALEDQLCTWVPGDASPDRLDALVYAVQHCSKRPVLAEVCRL